MKIGFLVGKISFGGGERVVQTLIKEMFELGHTIYIYSWEEEWNLQIKMLPYKVTVLPHPPIGIRGKFRALINLRTSLKVEKPDSLIIFSLALAEVGVFSAKSLGVPVLLTERVDPLFLPKVKIHRLLKKIVFTMADCVVFQTDQVKKYFSKSIQKKGVVIPNMIMDDYNLQKDVVEIKEVLAVGRLSEEKNFKMLIKAFADANMDGYKLRIVGEGPARKELESLILKLNMSDKIILEGKVDTVIPYYYKADIFVITSNHEGMPNVLMEAMASGLACISTDFTSGGARALISNGYNGILIPVNDTNRLKESLLFLIDNPIIKSQIKINALSIRAKNHKKVIIPQWISLIRSLNNSKG